MRWHRKSSSAEMPWWGWLFVPIWGPLWAILVACILSMFGVTWLKRWLVGPTEQWRPWFAWYPVTVEPWPDEQRAWLEWVERRAGHTLGDAVHRTALASKEEAGRG
ncbi:hypothetical protein [Methylobacterium sp. Gmos1]